MSGSIAGQPGNALSQGQLETIYEDLELQIASAPAPALGATPYIVPFPPQVHAAQAGMHAGNAPAPLMPLQHNLQGTLRQPMMRQGTDFTTPSAPRFRLDITRRFRENLTRTNVAQFAVNTGTAIAAGALGHANLPVISWSWAPALVFGTNDIVDQLNFEPRNNRHLDGYYMETGLANFLVEAHQDGRNTRTYFSRQRRWDGFLAASGTISAVGGHWSGPVGAAFNTVVHGPPTATAVFTLTRLCLARWYNPTEGENYREWINWIGAFKTARMFYRGFLTTLPAYVPQTILTALGVAGGLALVRNLTIGDYIEEVAQYIHFRAYDEQGYLNRSNDLQVTPDGEAVFRPNLQPNVLHRPNAGPATRIIEELFRDDLRGVGTGGNFVGELIKEPCGWMAISHKIMQF